jgi:hypothetical protein
MKPLKAWTTKTLDGAPPRWGFGIGKQGEGWIAYKLSTAGDVERLTPPRTTKIDWESKALATARFLEAIKREYAR